MFADYIKNARGRRGLSQREVADCLYVSEKTVSAWENGHCIPQPSLWAKLGDIHGITIMDIFEQLFQDSEMLEFPHLLPKEEYQAVLSATPFLSKKSIEDTLQHHDAGHGYCWDYVLTLTRQEFEVCKYLMQAHEGMTIFEAWDTRIQPRNTRMTRRETLCCS